MIMNEKNLQKFEEDEEFTSYHPVKPVIIFGSELDADECTVSVSRNLNQTDTALVLTKYLEWLSSCKNEITGYFHTKLKEDLPEDWFENIEVYDASITFLTLEDFGATVRFGEDIFSDHIIELQIDKYKITEMV